MKTTLPLLLLFACLGSAGFTAAADYDPLATVKEAKVAVSDAEVEDTVRDRAIPIRIYLPESGGKHALILFSHGLGGSRENNAYVAEHWAKRGFAVVAMQHAGSDAAVWKDAPAAKRFGALQKAANLESFMDRAADVKAVLDQLAKWNGEDKHLLKGRLDMEHVGMSGHSFGAVTTQAVSGQSFPLRGQALTDDRIDAAVAFSPSPPAAGKASQAFGSVKIPWLLMTGTKDDSPIGNTTPEKRREVFPHLPDGGKYELVLDGAEHMAFSDRTLVGTKHRNPNHHQAIIALTTAFWEAYLRGDEAAKTWLDGGGAKAVLDPKDQWQRK